MEAAEPSWYRSAQVTSLYFSLISVTSLMAELRPAFGGAAISFSKRMVPFAPPTLCSLLKVPESCHAAKHKIDAVLGQTLQGDARQGAVSAQTRPTLLHGGLGFGASGASRNAGEQ